MSAVLKESEPTAGAETTAVAEYSVTEMALAELRTKYKDVVFDLTTTKGDEAARKARKELVTLRTSLDAKRLELNADDQARIKKRNELAKKLTESIKELEDPIDKQILADEARREEARKAKIAADQARQAGIQKRIDWIVSQPLAAAGKPSAKIAELIETLSNAKVDADVFMEHAGRAQVAKDEALTKLETLRKAASDQEAEAERLRLEREELDRQRKEQAERDRVERERRQAEEAAAKAKRDAEELALAQQRLALAEQQRKIDEAAAELKRQQEAHLRPVLPEKAPEPEPEPAFELTPVTVEVVHEGPSDTDLVDLLIITYGMDRDDAIERLSAFSADNVTPF